MKAFKYRWRMANNEYIGMKDCEDEIALKNHLKNVGGELIEILETKEKVEEDKELLSQSSGKEISKTKVFSDSPQFNNGSKKKEPSAGIKIFGWLNITGAIFIYAIFAYLRLVKGVTPPIRFAGKIITSSQTQLFSDIFVIVIGMVAAIVGIGLLSLKKWARIMVLIFAWLDVGNSVYLIFLGHINLPLGPIFMIWFFNRETIAYQFNSKTS